VVIGIIGLLIGLLLPAVQKIRDAATRAQIHSDMNEISTGHATFCSTYDVRYIPSGFILSSNYNRNIGALKESREYYSRVWPKAIVYDKTTSPQTPYPGFTPLPPNPIGKAPNPASYYDIPLDGNQTIVFLLGGVPPTGGQTWPNWFAGSRTGFWNNATDPFGYNLTGTPTSPPDGTQAKGPFCDFKPKRLNADGQYLDPYGFPYYYFSCKNGNDYDYFGAVYWNVIPGFTREGGYGGQTFYMNPHVGTDNKYVRSDSFQIISAGRNSKPSRGASLNAQWLQNGTGPKFDQTTLWPGSSYMGDGQDDIANFSQYILGSDQ